MHYYFTLQFKMLNRHLKAFGLPPILGYLLAVPIFVGLSVYIFTKTEFAPYIYAFFAISMLSLLSETSRNDFLKTCFTTNKYWTIRIVENLILTLPFLLFLGYKNEWFIILGLIIVAILMARFHFNNQLNYSLPTPFHQYPFEFLVGFRTAFAMVIFAYFLTFMSISVGNFNLGVFAILLIYMICFSFYAQPDSQYYVWIFSNKAKGFLFSKIKIAFVYSAIMILPILIGLSIYFRENNRLLFLIPIIGFVYLLVIILAKYAAFPKAMNLPESLLIIASIFFPPFLLFTIPFFYKKSIKQLNQILA